MSDIGQKRSSDYSSGLSQHLLSRPPSQTMAHQLNDLRELRGHAVSGETVVLSDKECRGLVDCTLDAGTLKLAQSRGSPTILRSTVRGSKVVAEKFQRDYALFKARFVACSFHGFFSGVDFGRSPKIERDGSFGSVEECDFTLATLDGCRFFNTDVSTLRLPAWPHVVLVDFSERAEDVAATAWPGELGRYMRVCASQVASVKVLVLHVPSFARLVACTEESVKAAFEKFGGLRM